MDTIDRPRRNQVAAPRIQMLSLSSAATYLTASILRKIQGYLKVHTVIVLLILLNKRCFPYQLLSFLSTAFYYSILLHFFLSDSVIYSPYPPSHLFTAF